MDISEKIQASSHSGATLQVLKENGEYYVCKRIHTAIDKNFDAIQKQSKFKTLCTPSYDIQAIPVTSVVKSENELLIMMPYIEGLGGEQVAYKGSKTVAKNLKKALNFYLINSLSESTDGTYPIEDVHRKLESIFQNIKDKLNYFPNIESHLTCFRAFCNKDLQMPLGPCHGDLTLANLKITEENQLFLFDFLSCDINSPIQDAAKLIQDFEYGWSFRKEKDSARIKGEIFCEHAYPSFLVTLERLFQYELRVVEVLTILRIAPYINLEDTITINWFNNVMSKTMKKITG
ncbi:phosphotransferase family protein [Aliivibrio wodanis]|uniref:phosphotransferase family protein n=1 Tax=Aliivibrio wodanis TaxID=80852 RepID=UPI00406CF578